MDTNGLDLQGFCEKTYCTYMGVKEYHMSWHYHNGKCYGFRDSSASWGASQAYCRSMGASLAKMESEEEMEFIRDMWGGHNFWLGARDRITEGVWEWYDGSAVTWTYWGGSNPDGGTSENCLSWSGGGNQFWDSQRCYYSRYSVCSINVSHSLSTPDPELLSAGLSRKGGPGGLLLPCLSLRPVGRRL